MIKLKASALIFSLSVILPSLVSASDTVPVTINNNTVYEATINEDNSITINGVTVINGTIMRSINNSLPNSYYRPSLEEVNFLVEKIRKDKNMAAVYTGEFDLAPVPNKFPDSNSRELEVLGRDILLKEEYFNNSKYYSKEIPASGDIERQDAIAALYKALGQNQYDIQLNSRDLQADVSINKSPLLEVVQEPSVMVSKKGYYTDVFVTRTGAEISTKAYTPLVQKYWMNAIGDGVITQPYASDVAQEGISVGEFAEYVAKLMHIKGEPVLTDKEETTLLVVYGKKIPYYLSPNQVEAVKYLFARGILDENTDFKNNLTRSTMINILAKAKDSDSRLVFRNITIPYSEELVNRGFYPTTTAIEVSPISDPQITIDHSASTYYDYYVKVVDGDKADSKSTVFRDKDGRLITQLYVSSEYGKQSKPYPGSRYLGRDNGYYHFQIPISIMQDQQASLTVDKSGMPTQFYKGYYNPKGENENKTFITINTPDESDSPGSIKLEVGGGLYLKATADVESTEASEVSPVMYRAPFTPDYSQLLVDRNRKISDMGEITEPIPLAANTTSAYLTFYSDNINKLMWDGKPIKELIGNKDKNKPTLEDLGKGEYKLKITSSDPQKELMSLLTSTRPAGESSSGSTPAYVRTDKTAMVSLSYLKKNGMIDSVSQLSGTGNKGTFLLYSNYSNILVDTVNKVIIAGQSVTEIPEDDSSPLIISDPQTGEYLIDARAVMGIANGIMVIKSEGGTVNVSMSGKAPKYSPTSIYPMLGTDSSLYIRTDKAKDKMKVYLEDSYPLANFLVYRSRTNSISEDYLIVFKPRISGLNSSKARTPVSELKTKFNIELGDAESADIYPLTDKTVYAEGNSAPKTVGSDEYGYYYSVPDISRFDYFGYLEGKNTAGVIPIVTSKGSLLDLNLNALVGDDSTGKSLVGQYPTTLLNKYAKEVMDIKSDSNLVKFKKGSLGYTSEKGTSIKYTSILAAPAGVQGKYFPFSPKNWLDVMSKNVYFGSMKTKVERRVKTEGTMYSLKVGSMSVKELEESEAKKDSPFYEVFRGSGNAVFVYDVKGKSKLLNFESAGAADGGTSDPRTGFTLGGGKQNVFDWLAYKFQQNIQDTDDIMTLIILFLLNVVPRVMLFLLIGMSALTLVRDNRLVQLICDRWIDIYKVISFGITDINKVDARQMWISGFFAVVLLTMLNSGDILSVFAWITRGAHGIMNR